MSANKSILYLLCNKGIIVNLYKPYFLSSHFSFQPNKRVINRLTFPSLQPNTHEGKLNIFYPPTNFPSSHFSTLPTKQTLTFLHQSMRERERERERGMVSTRRSGSLSSNTNNNNSKRSSSSEDKPPSPKRQKVFFFFLKK